MPIKYTKIMIASSILKINYIEAVSSLCSLHYIRSYGARSHYLQDFNDLLIEKFDAIQFIINSQINSRYVQIKYLECDIVQANSASINININDIATNYISDKFREINQITSNDDPWIIFCTMTLTRLMNF
ncbi:Uncharacterized protein FWK35_00035650 [Aphis craccivora]|uniref:Uncharacterized protein n=1 Tax=Aphis craccivora TaxID=307492 RepID=A0A6G0VPT9_APHCR|nr:Uncharacterized protein FWK35_00035650 [Aphis craccivora]